MIGNISHVMTLANSIIGVSVLAMPFCFKQCGIVLATLVLLASSVLSRLACHFLIKSAVMSRRRNYEFLAFHAFGRTGKFVVELFIIGFLVGTCIAFFVVVGDLGPQIVGKILDKDPADIRTSLLVTTGIFIVFPLGLLRNIDSLSSVCTATIGFYLCLVIKIIATSTHRIVRGDWYDRVAYWRPAGILQCLPIFAMALFCQTQLFEIYEAIPNVCLDKMNQVVRGALNICTIVYLFVGFFGYVAYCTQPFTGNILMSFEPSLTSDLIKMGFVFSVAFSFPLVIFPCRASLNSLLFRRAHTHEPSNYYIPEMRFRCLTLTIVILSLVTGILIPNIEFVLGIVGSTIGVMICLIFPAAFFIAISTKNTNERLIAQAILFFGMWIMVLCTYANVYAMEESSNTRLLISTGKPLYRMNDIVTLNAVRREGFPHIQPPPDELEILTAEKTRKLLIPEQQQQPQQQKQQQQQQEKQQLVQKMEIKEKDETIEGRREPPIPVERAIVTEKPADTRVLEPNLAEGSLNPSVDDILKDTKGLDDNEKKIVGQTAPVASDPEPVKVLDVQKFEKEKKEDEQKNENLIALDAIKKEESELAAAGDLAEIEARREKFRQTLEKHKLEQLEMIQEQKELLKDIKEQKQELEMEKKRFAEEQTKKKIGKSEETKASVVQSNLVDRANKDLDPGKKESVVKKKEISLENKLSGDPPIMSSIVESDKSHGPILNALTNRTAKKNSSGETPPIGEAARSDTKVRGDATVGKADDIPNKPPLEYALPIALQLRNQTKENTEQKVKNTINADSMAIRRDILERSDRGKREATPTESSVTVTDAEEIHSIKKREDVDNELCRQTEEKTSNFISRDETPKVKKEEEETTSTVSPGISIRSIVYLAEQPFTDKIPLLDARNANGLDKSDSPKVENTESLSGKQESK